METNSDRYGISFLLHLILETSSVSKMLCLKKHKTMDNVQSNSSGDCNTTVSLTF